jgi:hypothetical protein
LVLVDKLKFNGITTIDIGVELSNHLSNRTNLTSLSIESQDFLSNLVQNSKTKPDQSDLKIIVFYNFGMLLDPVLQLKTEVILKNISKKVKLFLLWENEIELPATLHWGNNKEQFNLNFNNITPEIIQVPNEI